MSKLCLSDEQLQEKLSSGVNKLADCVAVTLGPRGRNVMLRTAGRPVITKDGVTVARFFETADPFEDAAASVLKEVAECPRRPRPPRTQERDGQDNDRCARKIRRSL